jgi:hypothetical protein
MGLDWVVIAKEENEREINPTDILGVRRASKTDPEVVERLRELYADRGEHLSFDDWLDSLVANDPPPIVISFGEDCRDAIPGVQAEVQYYGFRGKALEPDINRVSAFAVEDGRSLDWLWNDHDTTEQIDASVKWISDVLDAYNPSNQKAFDLAKRRFDAWRRQDTVAISKIDDETASDPDLEDHVFAIFAYLSARLWLSFWAGKGFRIAADY